MSLHAEPRVANTATVITEFLEAARTATIPDVRLWSEDAVLDATVPNWRYHRLGAAGIVEVYSQWYSAPGEFLELSRDPLADGEVVRYLISSTQDGVPYVAHHVHRLTVLEGRITSDVVFCGGRWSEERQREMRLADLEESADG